MSTLTIVGLMAIVLVVYVWSLYNALVTIKARIKASIQEIGNQLKRQADLIPNLTASVKGYVKHEKSVFEDITEARRLLVKAIEQGDTQKLLDVSEKMQSALAPIRAVFESTPQLQAVGPTTKLMDVLTDAADKVMYARRTLIDLTVDFNTKLVTFPSNLVAGLLGFKQEPGLITPETGEHVTVSEAETKTPKVDL